MKKIISVFILSLIVLIFSCKEPPGSGDPDIPSRPVMAVEVDSAAIDRNYTYDFGAGIPDNSKKVVVAITNKGSENLVLDDIQVEGSGAAAFSISKAAMVSTLAYGERTNFELVFSPGSPDVFTASVSIASNTSRVRDFKFNIRGEGQCLEGDDFRNLDQVYAAGSYFSNGIAMKSFVSGNYAYVADFQDGLKIIDVSNKNIPVLVGSHRGPGEAANVYVDGSYAYVAGGSSRSVLIYSVSDPANPSLAGELSHETDADQVYGIFVQNNRAYVTSGDDEYGNSNLFIWNVADPENPSLLGRYTCPNSVYSVFVYGSYAYLAELDNGVRVINISDPASPFESMVLDTDGTAWSVTAANGYLYVADGSAGLKIFGSSGFGIGFSLAKIGEFSLQGSQSYEVAVSGTVAYVADNTHGLMLVDVSNPSNPELVNSYQTEGAAAGVYLSDNTAFVSDEEGLSIYYTGDLVLPVSTPNPLRNKVKSGSVVTLTANEPAAVYYTLDGSTPNACSAKYHFPIVVNEDTTVNYFAVDYAGNREAKKSMSYSIDDTPPVTTPSVDPGLYAELVMLALESDEPAVIYYTLDGSTPSTASRIYSSPVVISQPGALVRYFAVDTAGNRETVKSAQYTIDMTAPVTLVSPRGGTFAEDISVTLTANEAAVIYYTLDGSEPTTGSTVYDAPIVITEPGAAINYFSVDTAGNRELLKTETYKIDSTPPVTTPSIDEGLYAEVVGLALSADEPAVIYYTLDGSTPTTASRVYTSPITISDPGAVVSYFAVDTAGNREAVKSGHYIVDTTSPYIYASPCAGIYPEGLTVTFSVNEPATVYYTLDGSEPSTASMVYGSSFIIPPPGATLKYFAVDTAGNQGMTKTCVYTVDNEVPVTTAYPEPGSVAESFSMYLSANEPATIYYTLDGSEPGTDSMVYTNPRYISFTSQNTEVTVKYFSVDLAGNREAVQEARYYCNRWDPPVVTATPAGGTHGDSITITLTANKPGKIYYTFSGGDPVPGSSSSIPYFGTMEYEEPITLDWDSHMWGWWNGTLKFLAVDQYGLISEIKTETYSVVEATAVTPKFLPGNSHYGIPEIAVEIKTQTSGATMKYTLDGSDPITSETALVYSEKLIISSAARIRAYAFREGLENSAVAEINYTFGDDISQLISTEGNAYSHKASIMDQDENLVIAVIDRSDGNKLRVLKWENSTEWTDLGTLNEEGYASLVYLVIDPSDNKPVICYYYSNTVYIRKWESGTTWINLGTITKETSLSCISMFLDPSDNKPIIAFRYYHDGSSYESSIMKWDSGTTWSDLAFPEKVYDMFLRADPSDNKVLVFYLTASDLKLKLMKWEDETTWSSLGTISDVRTVSTKILTDPLDKSLLILFLERNDNNLKAVKYEGDGAWTDLGVIMPGLTSWYTSFYRACFDPSDNKPVVAFKNYSDKSDPDNLYRIHLKKWNSDTSWIDMGYAPVKDSSVRSLYIDSDDNYIVSTRQSSSPNGIQVIKRFGEFEWDDLGFITTEADSNVYQFVPSNGIPFLISTDNGGIRILKLK